MQGYAKIAGFMGEHLESAMIERFSDINLQNILYLQAEIHGLREDLRKLEAQTTTRGLEEHKNFPLDWYTLAHTEENNHTNEQWQKVLQLRPRLREYNRAVLQFHQMSQLASPTRRTLCDMQEWLRRPQLGGVYLTGRDRNIWAEGKDLAVLRTNTNVNRFSRWVQDWAVPKYHDWIGERVKKPDPNLGASDLNKNMVIYSDSTILKSANLIGTVLASLLPVLAIIVLNLVNGTPARLGLVALFSALFSTCLWFLNDGRLVEVFSAASAFAAVQVVFIGTNG